MSDTKQPPMPVAGPSRLCGAFLTYLEPSEMQLILNTGFVEFESVVGIEGLAAETHDTLEIMAVQAKREGTGQFRTFIAKAKTHCPRIRLWHVWNPDLATALRRYGFTETHWRCEGEDVEGFIWSAPRPPREK